MWQSVIAVAKLGGVLLITILDRPWRDFENAMTM